MTSINTWDNKIIFCFKRALLVADKTFSEELIDVESFNKLKSFFQKLPKFLNYRFFYAPYAYDRSTTFPISFYIQNGIKKYRNYMIWLDGAGLEKNVNFIIESLDFIKNFCIDKGIKFDGYANFFLPGQQQKSFLKHLHNRQICPYVIALFPLLEQEFLQLDEEDAKYYMNTENRYSDLKNELVINKEIKNKLDTVKNNIKNKHKL